MKMIEGVDGALESDEHTRTHPISSGKLTAGRRQLFVNTHVDQYVLSSRLEVMNNEVMQSNYGHDDRTTTTNAADHSAGEPFSFPNIMSTTDVNGMEEKQHDKGDEKHIEIEVDNNNKPLIRIEAPRDSPAFAFYDDFQRRDIPLQPHTDSHDSLLQPDLHHPMMNNGNTAASSTDDLSSTHQLSSSVFHSKDSALGLSDDNLHYLQTNPHLLNVVDDDDEDEDDDDLQQQDKSK